MDAGAIDAGPTPFVYPGTPAGRQLEWFITTYNGAGFDAAAIQAHFHASVLASISAPALAATIDADRPSLAPLTPVSIEAGATRAGLVAVVVDRVGAYFRINLRTDPTAPNLLIGLLIQPAPDADPAGPADLAAVATAMAAHDGRSTLYVADVSNDSCMALASHAAGDRFALGSVFKLYVLSALAQSVIDQQRAWGDNLAIRDDHKSLPSGMLHLEPAGRTFALSHYATEMIRISDNTATDHLMRLLGRDAVERAVGASGHADPSATSPLLTTREMFTLKLVLTANDRSAYAAMNVADRRQYLDNTVAPIDLFNRIDPRFVWNAPIDIDTIEWFASTEEICGVLTRLWTQSSIPAGAHVRATLSANPGMAFDMNRWTFVGYKGGSEPGVLMQAWLLQRNDGRRYVVVVGFNDTASTVTTLHGAYRATQAVTILGR